VLQAGAKYVGPFTLPLKTGAEYITIQSSRAGELLEGVRVSPSQSALFAKIVTSSVEPAVKTAVGSHHFRFIGIEFATENAATLSYGIVWLGDGATSGPQNTIAKVPHNLIIDRCYVHGLPIQNVQRGIALNSAETSILNSYISEIHWAGNDTQALGGWNGPGPFHIINNYLEAAGENILFGGATPAIQNLIPSDIEIRRNHLFKPLAWQIGHPTYAGTPWTVKNLLEFKSGRRIVVEGNVLENNWAQAQTGFAVLFTVGNDSGAWAQVEDVQFTNNIVRHVASGVNMRGADVSPGSGLRRLTIRNNLFEDVGAFSGEGKLFQILRGPIDVTIDHNTAFHTGSTIIFDGAVAENFTYTNNIAQHNAYGVFGNGGSIGTAALNKYSVGWSFKRNIIAEPPQGIDPSQYPPDNYFPPSIDDLKFANRTESDYELAAGSRFKRKAIDGSDIGCDFAALSKATSWFKQE
jgi:hypothetical protein